MDIEMPLDIRLNRETSSAPYRSVWVKPPAESFGIKNVSRPCRIKIMWNITYAE
ncbi:MAG: hypothetical protein MUO89_03740 [Dehalococcoidia bacterium]|nr:hypothetical protein [Dehalococcoidia bacterium]